MEENAAVVNVRRIKEQELFDLSPDIRELLPVHDDGSTICMVSGPKEYPMGRLARHGHFLDTNHVLRSGVQYLIVQNAEVDIKALCNTLLTEQITYAQVEREMKMHKKQQHFEKEAPKDTGQTDMHRRQGSSFNLNTALETEVLVIENSVLSDFAASVLGIALGSRDSLELEGCHCTVRSLHLCNNMMRASGVECLSKALHHNAALANIYIGHNNIGDAGAKAVLQANFSRTVLRTLKLGGNVITDHGLHLVPACMENLCNLVVLHLNNNMIGDVGARCLAQGLALTESVQVLNLNGNRIRDGGLETISQALIGGPGTKAFLRQTFGNPPKECPGRRGWAPNTSLQALHLASNWLRDAGAERIAAVLEGNSSLTNVELASNRIGDEGARALAEALRNSKADAYNNQVSRKICLSCNNLSSIGMRELQIALAKSGNIHTINVEGMRCNFARRAAVQKENAHVTDTSFDGRFPAHRLRLEAIRPTTPRSEKGLAVQSARTAKEEAASYRGNLPKTPGRGNGQRDAATLYLNEDPEENRKSPVMTDFRFLNLDDDPKFQTLCQRLQVPVADVQRSKLRELEQRQREQRTRIYDRFLDMHARHPRPVLNAAVRMQSLFKIRQSKLVANETRSANRKKALAMERDAMAAAANLKDLDVVARAAAKMLEPLANRFWNAWKGYLEQARTMRADVVELYSGMCTAMGVTACGCMALKTYMGEPFDLKLDMQGLGMLPHSGRALAFTFRGLETCKLCRGVGSITSDALQAVRSDPTKERKTAGEIFNMIDIDQSGTIDSYELSVAFNEMGVQMSPEEIRAFMKQVRLPHLNSAALPVSQFWSQYFEGDKAGDGTIDKQGFKDLFQKLKSEGGRAECAICEGQGHTGQPAVVEKPFAHEYTPILKARELLGYDGLEQLRLSGNCLRRAGTADIVDAIIELRLKVKVLTLARNELGESGAAELARLLSSPDIALLECDLSENALGDGGVSTLAASIASCSSLLSLNLSKTSCGSPGAQALGHMLEKNRSLTDLDVSWNGIGGVGAVAFSNGLGFSRSLLRLHAQWNGFCDLHAMVALSEAISGSSRLKFLNLSQNRIAAQGALVLAEALKSNVCLLELVMSGNPLSVSGARSLLRCAQMGAGEADHLRSIQLNNCAVGILDMSMFNPVEPSGRYSLDMENEYSRRVLRNVLKLIAEGRAEFEHDHVVQTIEVPRVDGEGNPVVHALTGIQEYDTTTEHVRLPCFMTKQEFDAQGETDSDPLQWEIPSEGMIEFSLVDLGRRARHSKLTSKRLYILRDEFRSAAVSMTAKMQSFDRMLPGSTVLSLAQFQIILAALRPLDDDSWLTFVTEGFYKVAGDCPARDILGTLTPEERQTATKVLGDVTFDFHKNNPTGYYHLDLSIPTDRRVAELLVECKNAQFVTEKRFKDYCAGGVGGQRELDGRSWRNATLDGKPLPFQRDWKVPKRGVLRLDFVQLIRKDPDETNPMTGGYFKALIKEISSLDADDAPVKSIQAIRLASTKQYFSVAQVSELMYLFGVEPRTCFQPRVELLVLVFARTVDWYALHHMVARLLPYERRQVYHRIGHENLFEEAMAVNYYELDLADAGQRFVAQQVIQLAVTEPGENCIEMMYEGCDFEVPASWTKFVPRSGQLRLSYVREQQVMEQIVERGTFDTRKTNPFFCKSAFGDFLPEWIKPYCPKGYPQPVGKDWIRASKLRLVKSKIQEKAALDATQAFEAIDADGSGELSRAELLMSLFKMGVWLHQSEANALVTVLDSDETGLIDLEEFQAFWESHTFD